MAYWLTGGERTPGDFMPQWDAAKVEAETRAEQSPEQMIATFRALTAKRKAKR